MAFEASVESLQRALTRLQETVSALHVTVTEDRPAGDAAMLVDRLDTLVTDLSSTLEEASAGAAHAQLDIQPNGSLDGARTALYRVHDLLNRFVARYIGELAHYDEVAQLLKMGRERGHGWREWCFVVKTAIERCAAPLADVVDATLRCWNELADRLARQSVSVQATNIGQQITVREDELEMARRAG